MLRRPFASLLALALLTLPLAACDSGGDDGPDVLPLGEGNVTVEASGGRNITGGIAVFGEGDTLDPLQDEIDELTSVLGLDLNLGFAVAIVDVSPDDPAALVLVRQASGMPSPGTYTFASQENLNAGTIPQDAFVGVYARTGAPDDLSDDVVVFSDGGSLTLLDGGESAGTLSFGGIDLQNLFGPPTAVTAEFNARRITAAELEALVGLLDDLSGAGDDEDE
jgi:hypothetical protein